MTYSQRRQIIDLIMAVEENIRNIARVKGGYAFGFQTGDDLLHDVCILCLQKSEANPDFLLRHNAPTRKILRIAHNLCVDSYRRATNFPFDRIAKSNSESNELVKTLREAIASLPGKLRDVITYRFIERKSRTEIAIMLRVSVHTVTRRHNQGIALLKDYFDVPA